MTSPIIVGAKVVDVTTLPTDFWNGNDVAFIRSLDEKIKEKYTIALDLSDGNTIYPYGILKNISYETKEAAANDITNVITKCSPSNKQSVFIFSTDKSVKGAFDGLVQAIYYGKSKAALEYKVSFGVNIYGGLYAIHTFHDYAYHKIKCVDFIPDID